MATSTQSNPVYYSLSTDKNPTSRTVVLNKRPGHSGFGVYLGEDVPSGLYIVTVERNSPAADANIQPGDRVLAVNGQLVSSMSGNPKDMVVKAATNSESLTLTIQSTDIFQTLNIPLINSYSDNNKSTKQKPLSKQTSNIDTNLEK
jgi:C-terminal processing protease CtpA/Prc